MAPDKFQQLMELFHAAIDLDSSARRQLLDERCADLDLRREVEALLAASPAPGESPGRAGYVATAAGLQAVAAEGPPGVIDRERTWRTAPTPVLAGNYRVLRVLGEGGMGIVYQAEQAFPRRTVALKAIRPGLASRGILRRFQNEAQILARLHHPGIAQIYEAGAADEASPDEAFFAMEFVDGRPLTEFATAHALDVRARARLMLRVCEAVQHAHQRGVIHRDLKPSNILVEIRDGEPQPKVLDFGVARTIDAEARATSIHTGIGNIVGTLPYMSPEQVAGSGDAIDVRSDVYALGVVLFQLLAGRLPHDLSTASLPEAARIIRDQPAPRLGDLDRSFRGDIETIAAKALDKEPARRYQSAGELGEDLRRFLAGEPIAARRDSLIYLARKQARRFRVAAAVAAAFIVLLAGFLIHARAQARELADKLAVANVERARALAESGSVQTATDALWREFLARPESAHAHWALRETFARRPVRRTMGNATLQPTEIRHAADDLIIARGIRGRMGAYAADLSAPRWESTVANREIQDIAVSADGERAWAICDFDRIIELDVRTGDIVRQWPPPLTDPLRIDAHPTGRTLAIGGRAGEIVLLDPESGQVLARTTTHGGRYIHVLQFSPDGASLLSAGIDNTLRIWNAADLEPRVLHTDFPSRIFAAAFLQGSRTVAVAAADHQLLFLDPARGTMLGRTRITTAQPIDLALIRNGSVLAVGGVRSLDLVDLSTRDVIRTITGDAATDFAVLDAQDPDALIVAGVTAALQEWDVDPAPDRSLIGSHAPQWIFVVALSPDGSRLITADGAGEVRLWDARSRSLLARQRIASAAGFRTGLFMPGQGRVAFATPEGVIHIRTAANLDPVAEFQTGIAGVTALDVTPDGRRLLIAAANRRLAIIDAATGAILAATEPASGRLFFARFSPDSRRVIAAGESPTLELFDAATLQPLNRVEGDWSAHSAAFTPDSRIIACTGRLRTIDLRRADTLELIGSLEGHAHLPVGIVISADGQLVAAGAADGAIRIWERRTGNLLRTLTAGDREISRIALSPDSRRLYAGGAAGQIWTWDLNHFDRHIAGNLDFQLRRAAIDRPADVARRVLRALDLTPGQDSGRPAIRPAAAP